MLTTAVIPSTPKRSERASSHKGGSTPCIVCGTGIAESRQEWFVHVVSGGTKALHPDSEAEFAADPANESGDVGCHPIGADCRERFPDFKPFTFKMDR